jgi:hypothetical protein
MNPLIQSKNTTILPVLIALTLGCFALSPQVRAVIPPPDGGYPNANTAEGDDALFSLTTGAYNVAVGFNALYNNSTGVGNIAVGGYALSANTTGSDNIANGNFSLYVNTTGFQNTASGNYTLFANTTGDNNTAVGYQALEFNTSGHANVGTGSNALGNNTTGNFNTASGFQSLFSNTTGGNNTALGYKGLFSNTAGGNNTANGLKALYFSTTGDDNTGNGVNALFSNTSGSFNTANGSGALTSNTIGNNNTAVGVNSLLSATTGSSNIALGASAGANLTTGSNNINVGNLGVAGESKTIRIGTSGTHTKTFIAGISGVTVPGGVGVIVGTNGKLGTVVSSARFKDQIKPMDKASEAILALKPVTFRYKHELDAEGTPQFGLVAEDVEKVNPDLVARDANGKAYTVRYEAVDAMLLNEFLKEHRKGEQQDRKIEKLEATIAEQQKQIEALTTGLQKVSDQIELSKPAPRTVVNNQ